LISMGAVRDVAAGVVQPAISKVMAAAAASGVKSGVK